MTRTPRDGKLAADAVADDPKTLRAQIEKTRAELGDTVEALAAKADVRARTREKVTEMTARARQKAAEAGGAVQAKVAKLAGQVPAAPAGGATGKPVRRTAGAARTWLGAAALAAAAVALVAWRRGRRR